MFRIEANLPSRMPALIKEQEGKRVVIDIVTDLPYSREDLLALAVALKAAATMLKQED